MCPNSEMKEFIQKLRGERIKDSDQPVHHENMAKRGLFVKFIEFCYASSNLHPIYEGESIKNQPNLFLGESDLFFFNVIAL